MNDADRISLRRSLLEIGARLPLAAWAAISILCGAVGCGPAAAPRPPQQPVVSPAPAEKVPPKPPEAKPSLPEEAPALAPPMLIAPAGPPEPGVKQPGAAIPISFDDLQLALKPGVAFHESLLTPRAKDLVGKQVAIRGYIYSELTTTKLTRFPFLRSAECPFGPGANAEHVIDVQMEGESTTEYTTRPVTVIGVLSAEPYIGDDGTAWAIFRIVARRVQR